MKVPVDRTVQNMLENDAIAEYKKRRQAARRERGGSISEGQPATHSSVARRLPDRTPPPRGYDPNAVRATASGPAPSYVGFALSLLILLAAAMGIGVVVVIWVIQSAIARLTGGDQ